MVILNSLRQLVRTPVKTLFFFMLLILTTALLVFGFSLWLIADTNIQQIESIFLTIGTVEQKMTSLEISREWDAEKKDYIYYKDAVIGDAIPISALNFEGANYIHEPEQRPFYYAYDPEFIVLTNPLLEAMIEESYLIVEMQPLEDCETGDPVLVRITKVLMGYPTLEGTRVMFCNHYEKKTYKLYADKTYIVCLEMHIAHKGNEAYVEYTPRGLFMPASIDKAVTAWDEVTDHFYATPKGKVWLNYMHSIQESIRHTIPVIPTNCTKLLIPFFSGDARIIKGRDISDEEYKNGRHICLIRQDFAEKNGLSVGDSLRLPLIYTGWFPSSLAFHTNGEAGAFVPLNDKGGLRTHFDNDIYSIVGIYDVAASSAFSPYALGGNAVIIPSASVTNIDNNSIPIKGMPPMSGYSTSFQIPNGTIEKFMAAFEKQGIDDLEITFFDKGYSKIKAGLDDMKNMALLMFIVGAATTLLTVILFCHLFISKQRRRTAIERSMGLSKKLCILSMLATVIVIVVPACIFGSLTGSVFTRIAAPQVSTSQPEQAFDTTYSDWVNSADNETDSATISVEIRPINYLAGAAVIPLSLIIAWIVMRGNLKQEPLRLLGEKER